VLTATSRPADGVVLLVPLLTAANGGAWTHEEIRARVSRIRWIPEAT